MSRFCNKAPLSKMGAVLNRELIMDQKKLIKIAYILVGISIVVIIGLTIFGMHLSSRQTAQEDYTIVDPSVDFRTDDE